MRKTIQHIHRKTRWPIWAMGMATALLLMVVGAYSLAYWGRILPGVAILGVNVGNHTGEEAAVIINRKLAEGWRLKLTYEDQSWETNAEELGMIYLVPETVNRAWAVGREGNLFERIGAAWSSFFEGKEIDMAIRYDGDKLDLLTEQVGSEVEIPVVWPALKLVRAEGKKVIQVNGGRDGVDLDEDELKNQILARAVSLSSEDWALTPTKTLVSLDEKAAEEAKLKAEGLLEKRLVFRLEKDQWVWEDGQLVGMASVVKGEGFEEKQVREAIAVLSESVNRESENAAFKFENGRVSEFRPGRDGVEVEEDRLLGQILGVYPKLLEGEVEIEVSVKRTPPMTATEDVNNLGIKELVGRGRSSYSHSIANRIHNVALASERINGVLVPPDSVFSFNEAVGEISASTGYKSAYVISGGRTVLGDGGGVCQVSTTLFRAILDAGLPIVERKAHAYRVGYYEEDSLPGIDATVYAPTADLKFKNDTGNYLLIQTAADSVNRKLVIDIYGTKDGRVVAMTKPKVWGQTPPPPTLYQDDPTLPAGTTKQIDWSAWGAKTSFDYRVTRNGEVIYEKTFFSNYRPWQAIFLRGTATLAQQ